MEAFAATVLALGIVNSLLLAVLAFRRVRLAARARRRALLEDRFKPAVLAFLEGEAELPEGLTAAERVVLAEVLGGYGRLLRGPALARITSYFEDHGTVEQELASLANDRAAWRRAAAAYRLGDISADSSKAGLIAALHDPDRDVRTAAARSLGRLRTPDAVDPLLAAFSDARVPRALIGWALLQIGEPALPRLRASVADDEAAHRLGAVRLIGLLGGAADAELVAARLRDSSADVRAEAARALARLGSPRSFPQLLAALDDRVPAVQAAAASALGRQQADALEPLLVLAQRGQFEVARAAARAAVAIDLDASAAAAATSSSPAHLAEAIDLARLA